MRDIIWYPIHAMILTPEAALARLNSPDNLCNMLDQLNATVDYTKENRFKGGGAGQEISFDRKVLIGTVAHFDTAKNVAAEFNVSPKTVDRLKAGVSGEGYEKNQELVEAISEKVDSAKEVIKAKALDRLLQAVEIVGDRLSNTERANMIDTKDISTIAKDMSSIVHKLDGGDKDRGGPKVSLTIIAPNPRKLSNYDIIDVN